MIGAIIGDVVGSRFEFKNTNTKDFEFFHKACTFTDDTVMTLAVAESIMRCYEYEDDFDGLSDYATMIFHRVGRKHQFCGYGGRFYQWMMGDVWIPYNSCGNGSAMRISPVGDVAASVDQAKELSYKLTSITHNHPEGIKGAEATAVAKTMLALGKTKEETLKYVEAHYYELNKTTDDWRKENNMEHGREICQITVPQAFACFKEGESFEDVIRNCVSIGGDTDTIAAIAGGIAESCYPVPDWMRDRVRKYLSPDLLDILDRWERF